MNKFRSIHLLVVLLISLFSLNSLAKAPKGLPEVYDLKAYWSHVENPSPPFTIYAFDFATSKLLVLEHVDNVEATGVECCGVFPVVQPGFSAINVDPIFDIVPVWFKTLFDGSEFGNPFLDSKIGDIVVHTGRGPNITFVNWMSPKNGVIDILGSVWPARNIGRVNDWSIFVKGNPVTRGVLDVDGSDGSLHTRSTPFFLEDGDGGTTALRNIPVSAGEGFSLVLSRNGPGDEDYVGVDLKVLFSEVDEGD